jgi:ribulose-phosphate 3-epimerase
MAIIVPTVLATTPDEYGTMLARAEDLSKRVHVDICDGRFAENQTISLAQVHVGDETALDLHLMLQDPVSQLETALSLKPQLVIFHVESSGDLAMALKHAQELGVHVGVAILPQTSVDSAKALIELADHVLIFTGHLGYNKGDFQPDQLERVSAIRAIKPEVEISVDGGVNDRNATLIAQRGVDVLYSGGFLQGAEDPHGAFDSMTHQVEVPV